MKDPCIDCPIAALPEGCPVSCPTADEYLLETGNELAACPICGDPRLPEADDFDDWLRCPGCGTC